MKGKKPKIEGYGWMQAYLATDQEAEAFLIQARQARKARPKTKRRGKR